VTYARIEGVKCPVARIILGTASLGGIAPTGRAERLRRQRFLDEVLSSGGNAFDTARVYGLGASERTLGDWLAGTGSRERIVVITKGAHPSLLTLRSRVRDRCVREDVERSLRALHTDYIDLWMLHRDDPEVPVAQIMEILHDLRQRGVVHACGVSNWSHARVEEANRFARAQGIPGLAVSSPQFSLVGWRRPPFPHTVSLSGPNGREGRAWYCASGLPVLAWSSLAAGYFSPGQPGRPSRRPAAYRTDANEKMRVRVDELARQKGVTSAQVALAYLLAQPFPVFPIVSTHRAARFQENALALDLHLTPAELGMLETGSPS